MRVKNNFDVDDGIVYNHLKPSEKPPFENSKIPAVRVVDTNAKGET